MTDSQAEKQPITGAEVLRRQADAAARRGWGFPEWPWLAEKDPEFEAAHIDYEELIFTRKNPALPVKYRELIDSVILAFRHYPTVGDHLRRAIREGATLQEAIEAFEVATIPGGMPVLHFALPFLIEIDKEIQEGKLP
jgi:alkylhydroperoxidase/carboxymuconolactone decarboxylase family protein YurZ